MVSLGRIFHTESPVMVSFEEYTSSYEAFHSAVHLSAVLLVFQRIALVVFLLSFCESDIKFCKTLVVDIQFYRYDCESGLMFSVLLEIPYLLLVEQELPVTPGLVVIIRAIEVR